jgi:Glutathione S-transferase
MDLFAHPFSSFCQKVLIALYEKDLPFTFRLLEPSEPANGEEWARHWPLKKMPLLVDGDRVVVEATAIIEYLEAAYPTPARLIPADPLVAAEVRMMDRIFDLHVSVPQQKFIYDVLRPESVRDPFGVEQAAEQLDTLYAWLDERMQDRTWAVAEQFSMADCAAAPALFYADWTHPIPERFATLRAYRARLLARPSMARCVEAARPYRAYFPLGAPDRD